MAGIVDGNPVNASYTNSKLASKDGDNTFIGKQTLNRAGSGGTITDLQQTVNNNTADILLKINSSEKGAPNGVATLDVTGRLPASQLTVDVFQYQGTWNASTNSPTLVDGTGSIGDLYRVTVAGTQDLGSGSITYAVGDYIILNSSNVWEKADTTDSVNSVNGKTGTVVTYDSANDNATGSNATLSAVTTTVVRLTNASLSSIDMIPAGVSAYEFILENKTGVTITINNETGGTAANRILTGSGSNMQMENNSSLKLVYDSTSSRWHVVGGAGGANKTLSNLTSPTAINESLLPTTPDNYDLGASTQRWSGVHADLYNLYDSGSSIQGRFKPTNTSPSGLTTGVQLESVASTEPLILNSVNATGNTGSINIESGNSTSNNSGDIKLQIGTAGGTRGKIYLRDGSEGTSGHVWTSTGVNGQGSWQAAASSGANTSLSNLTTTSINQDLLPSASNVRSLGTTLLKWKELILNKIRLYSSISTYWTGTTSAILVENDASPSVEFLVGSEDAATGADSTKYTTLITGAQQDSGSSLPTGRITLWTGDNYGTGATGDLVMYSGWNYSNSGPTGGFSLGSGDSSNGTGATGSGFIESGEINAAGSSANTGSITVRSGNNAGSGNSGSLTLQTGTVTSGTRGKINLNAESVSISNGTNILPVGDGGIDIGSLTKRISQVVTFDTVHSEGSSIYYSSGNLTGTVQGFADTMPDGVDAEFSVVKETQVPGKLGVFSRNKSSGTTDTISVQTGNNSGGSSGNIEFRTGTATSTRGKIYLKDGSEGTSGHVWTSTGTNGEGAWQAASGGGANTTLSNLGTTSVNASIIPQTTLSIDLGSATGPKSFLGLYVRDIYKQDAVKIIDMLNSRILDASGNASIYYDSKYLITGPQSGPTIKLDWSGNLKAHVKIEPNADGTLDLGTSSLYWNTAYLTKIVVPTTVTSGGTTGNQTINKISGTVNFAASAISLTVTNSHVTANSIVMAVIRTNDSTATIKNVVPSSGSFTINLGAAATAETSVGFFVIN